MVSLLFSQRNQRVFPNRKVIIYAAINLIGAPDPFVHVSLKRGEKIYCESDAMVMIEQNLELKGKLQGGVVQSFTPICQWWIAISATHWSDSWRWLPIVVYADGDMQGVRCRWCVTHIVRWRVSVAATDTVDIQVKMQGFKRCTIWSNGCGFWSCIPVGMGR